MSHSSDGRFQLPTSLREKLARFRRRVWYFKLLEGLAAAAIGVLVGFLLTYAADRFFDTPRWLRGLFFVAATVACGAVPMAIERWVWRRRRIDQLADLLSETHPNAGDQLLGVIHLSEDQSEQSRSPELVAAAIRQVSASVEQQDLTDAIPRQQHRQRGAVATLLAIATVLLLIFTASAATNAWARFLTPWNQIPRYTFASLAPFPETMIVPHGEPFDLFLELKDATRWRPDRARLRTPGQREKLASLSGNGYRFEMPGQILPLSLDVKVGDFRGEIGVEPMLRPELAALRAEFRLPDYLKRAETIRRDIRGASTSIVRGSTAVFIAAATRPLSGASVNGVDRLVDKERFSSDSISIDDETQVELEWQDQFGLSGQEPLRIRIDAIEDEPPSVICENLPRRKRLLENEVLSFQIRAHDDFGVKNVGIEWQEMEDGQPGKKLGEAIIGAGGPMAESLELAATFCPEDFGLSPQTIALRVFVEDFLPQRPRSYSTLCVYEILDPSQHAIWVNTELSRWHRMSLDVRDRELQLHATNQELRDLSADQLGTPENRERLAQQAEQEQVNGRRLANLVRAGEGLLREAMRNREIGAEELDQWAEMVQVLKDISDNRMPAVAELLKKASENATPSPGKSDDNKAQVGQNRLEQGGSGEAKPEGEAAPPVPAISDIESTQHDLESLKPEKQDNDSGAPQQGRFTLPDTKLAGDTKSEAKPPAADEEIEQAVLEQEGLLAEFEKVANELNQILANLEGSTLVKRLKASSRQQQQVAAGLASLVDNAFGVPDRDKNADAKSFLQLAEAEASSSQEVSHIMDDMSAYFERSRLAMFQYVLDDMKTQDVTASLRSLSDQLRSENGLSIAQAEYWSDTLDRWAEDLVEATQSGSSPGGKPKGSLPPAIVLEVLQLLEGEVNLRERTRVAEQARPAVSDTQHMESANRLAETQDEFFQRVDKVIDRILELPNAEGDFANELNMLSQVAVVMKETTEILYKPETGPPAIAAETEIIELLLKSKRFNPNASGGSGADPGGGGGGKTETPALALVGAGVNAKEVREESPTLQATGSTGRGLPEEFRSGLDQYFNRLEQWKTK